MTIEIRTDDSIRVTEVIEYDFGSTQHHGIFRDVPTREAYDDRYDRVFPLHVESVSATGGASADYEVSNEPGGITRIKIGDPDVTTSGVHTYTIVYTVDAAMNGFPDHDELYWNAIGDQWEVPVDHATATVEAPAEISDAACYAGPLERLHGLRPPEDRGRDGPVHTAGSLPVRGVHRGGGAPEGSGGGAPPAAGRAVEHRSGVLADVRHPRRSPACSSCS